MSPAPGEARAGAPLTPVPSLDELAAEPTKAATLPPELATDLLGKIAALTPILLARAVQVKESKAPADDDGLLTVPEVALRLNLAQSYVYELVRLQRLPAVRAGKYVRIRLAALRAWVAAHEGLTQGQSVTYSTTHEGRRVASAPATPRPYAGSTRRAGRRPPQLDCPPGAGGTRHQGVPRATGPTARADGPQGQT